MNCSFGKMWLTLCGLSLPSWGLAASPGFVSCGYTLPQGVRVNCNNSVVTISVNMRTWHHRYEGDSPETKLVFGRYLMLRATNSGALTYTMTYLFDLRTRTKVLVTEMESLYEDKQRLVFMPLNVSSDDWASRPEIGIFKAGGKGLRLYVYDIHPRPSCGFSRDDVMVLEREDFIGSAKGFSFIREDKCGRFVISKPWPQ
ncbi:hypothetical protein V3W47_10260 [Deinococcus sp. YIM 134068]|uniref:hypothetical protein n=1 Tax=Deinococcus lichenicola TaxID=3118910 RepID=UPI002F92DD34